MSFRIRRDRRGNTTTHEEGVFSRLFVQNIKPKPKTGTLIEIDASLNFNNQGLVTTLPDNISVDSISAKTGSTITINDTLCLTNDIVLNNIKPKTGSLINIDASLNFTNMNTNNFEEIDVELITSATISSEIERTEVFAGFFNRKNPFRYLSWGNRISSENSDEGLDLFTNSVGEVFATGSFGGTATIYESGASSASILLQNNGSDDAYVIKYDNDGEPLWINRVSSSSEDKGTAIAGNSSGIYVAGHYSGNATVYDVGGTSPLFSLPNNGSKETFLVKYTDSGTPEWINRIEGGGCEALGIAVNSSAVVVTGFFEGTNSTIYMSGGTAVFQNMSGATPSTAFIVKYSLDGNPQWVNKLTGATKSKDVSISDSGDIAITGTYGSPGAFLYKSGGTDIDLSDPFIYIENTNDIFLVIYQSDGNPKWHNRITTSNSPIAEGNGIIINDNGVIVVGEYDDTTEIYESDKSTIFSTLSGFRDGFIVKYDNVGNPQWVNRITGISISNNAINDVCSQNNGDIIVIGSYNSTINTYEAGGLIASLTLSDDTSNTNTFVIKYSNDGNYIWAEGLKNANIIGNTIAVNNKDVFISGYYFGSLFGETSASNDMYIAKYGDYDKTLLNISPTPEKGFCKKIIMTSEYPNESSININADILKSGLPKTQICMTHGNSIEMMWSDKIDKWVVIADEGTSYT